MTVAHAGRRPAQNIIDALSLLGITRIDHGVLYYLKTKN
ncbi:hypothetical protein OK016_05150 [Vibrio chagasii]|nr:hypothetical protein [Vibrio chagasii]